MIKITDYSIADVISLFKSADAKGYKFNNRTHVIIEDMELKLVEVEKFTNITPICSYSYYRDNVNDVNDAEFVRIVECELAPHNNFCDALYKNDIGYDVLHEYRDLLLLKLKSKSIDNIVAYDKISELYFNISQVDNFNDTGLVITHDKKISDDQVTIVVNELYIKNINTVIKHLSFLKDGINTILYFIDEDGDNGIIFFK